MKPGTTTPNPGITYNMMQSPCVLDEEPSDFIQANACRINDR